MCPDEYSDNTYTIDFNELYMKGKRGILFDIDNTLVGHGKPVNDRALELFAELNNMGFKTCLISNNGDKRVKPFADAVGAFYVAKAGKPGRRGYLEGVADMGIRKDEAVFIGDQVFTDVWGARRAGIYSIMVKQLEKKEPFNIILKRILEKPIIAMDRLSMK
ncbi:MAG: HAD hydrolase-like protein [Lachnospiraceae bacterium]|nr:HAD hydrolase-like protein [Lachnospiraceae bacterium]